jgi:hypothetical protein
MTIQPITYKLLKSKGACARALAVFRRIFGDTAPLTVEAAVVNAQTFNWDFAARHSLSASALKAYDEARASAWKAYNEATAPAWKAYNEATASAGKAYNEATAPALKAYNEAKASAEKAYDEAKARTFAEAYMEQGQ